MSSADVHGNFLWHELVTTDPSAAGAFYSRVLGWKAQAWDKDPAYTIWSNAHGHLGGMMRLPAEAQANGTSPSWLSYVAVADVDAAAAAAQRLGGRVVKPASSLPNGERYAVLADPQSAPFGVCTAPSSSGGHTPDEFVWHELRTTDQPAAFRFYRELLGWEQLGVHDMGAMGPYLLFGRNGRQLGGMFSRPGGGSPAHWLVYVRVASAAKVADAASAAGGRVVQAPHQVPGGSWAAQLADPQGAAIAINQPPAAAAATASAAAAPKPAAALAPRPAAAPAAPRPAVTGAPKPVKPVQPAAGPAAPTSKPQAVAPAPRPPAARPAEVARAPSTAPTAPAAVKPAAAAVPSSAASASTAKAAPSPAPASAPKAAAGKAAGKATKTAARKKARKAAPRRASPAKKRKKVAARKKSAHKKSSARRGAAKRGTARRGAAKRRPAARRGAGRTRRKAAKRPARRAARRKSAPRRKR